VIKSGIICDVCKSVIDHRDHNYKELRKMQMLRNFDSTDGRSFFNHLTIESIHICKVCYNKVLDNGMYLIDNRVQGYGDIELREKGDE